MKIAIIGSNPSKENLNLVLEPDESPEHDILITWIQMLSKLTEVYVSNFYPIYVSNIISKSPVKFTNDEIIQLMYKLQDYEFIITLGPKVKKAVIDMGIVQYNLPSPNEDVDREKCLEELTSIANSINIIKRFNFVEPDYTLEH